MLFRDKVTAKNTLKEHFFRKVILTKEQILIVLVILIILVIQIGDSRGEIELFIILSVANIILAPARTVIGVIYGMFAGVVRKVVKRVRRIRHRRMR